MAPASPKRPSAGALAARHLEDRPCSDLLDIRCPFGFRGEALGLARGGGAAFDRDALQSRRGGRSSALREGGGFHPVRPCRGFARHDRGGPRSLLRHAGAAEVPPAPTVPNHRRSNDMVRRLAMAAPGVAIRLRDVTVTNARVLVDLVPEVGEGRPRRPPGRGSRSRLPRGTPSDFPPNAEGLRLGGYAALPTYFAGGSAVQQFILVNGRPVRDRMPPRRPPRGLCGPSVARPAPCRRPCDRLATRRLVDVKRPPGEGRGPFPRTGSRAGSRRLRHPPRHSPRPGTGLRGHGRGCHTRCDDARSGRTPASTRWTDRPGDRWAAARFRRGRHPIGALRAGTGRRPRPIRSPLGRRGRRSTKTTSSRSPSLALVIVDPARAHERLVYEKLKAERDARGVWRQLLLVPDIVESRRGRHGPPSCPCRNALPRRGLVVEAFGPGAVAVHETPAVLGPVDGAALVADILDEISEFGATDDRLRPGRCHPFPGRLPRVGPVGAADARRGNERASA